jgi:ubiquinone/menaquinone biosynthesis C-methylase UbiE
MISIKRYKIARKAERKSHILKKDINIFDRRLSSSKNIVLPYIKQVEDNLRAGASVVDVGSGPTCLVRFFRGGRKVFLDPLMDFYKEYYKDRLPEDGEFVNSMAENMPLLNETFDVAFCYNVLDHSFNPPKIIDEIKRVLKPGGYLLLGIYTHNPMLKIARFLAEQTWIFKEKPHPYSFTIKGLKNMLREGFLLQKIDIIKGKESVFNFKRRFYVLILKKK